MITIYQIHPCHWRDTFAPYTANLDAPLSGLPADQAIKRAYAIKRTMEAAPHMEGMDLTMYGTDADGKRHRLAG
jgi:hypothetical protein